MNYGCGWEHELDEYSIKEIRQRQKEYRENCPQYPVKVVKGRERIRSKGEPEYKRQFVNKDGSFTILAVRMAIANGGLKFRSEEEKLLALADDEYAEKVGKDIGRAIRKARASGEKTEVNDRDTDGSA